MKALRQIGKRPPDVNAGHAKERLRRRSEEPDVEGIIEKNCRDVRAVQNILQVCGDGALMLQGLLELTVQGGQFLVESLQFLL